MTKNKSDFGASHDFGSGREKVSKGTNELRIGRSVYMKESMLRNVHAYAIHNKLTLSAAFDIFLQCGYAWKHEKAGQQNKEWLDV